MPCKVHREVRCDGALKCNSETCEHKGEWQDDDKFATITQNGIERKHRKCIVCVRKCRMASYYRKMAKRVPVKKRKPVDAGMFAKYLTIKLR